MDFAQARYYNKNFGRFNSVDPIKMKKDRQSDPQRINLYVYVRNNPLFFTDPTGKDIYLENNTENGRRKALLSATATLRTNEKKNIGYRLNSNGQYELYIKDPNKIDLNKASPGYNMLIKRMSDSNLKIGFTLVEKGKSVMGKDGAEYSQKGLANDAGGVTIGLGNGNVQVIVAEGGVPNGVKGLTASGKDTQIAFSEAIVTAHELFGETLKYTAKYSHLQKQDDATRKRDSQIVIAIENSIRKDQGLPLRSGKDHEGTVEWATVEVRP